MKKKCKNPRPTGCIKKRKRKTLMQQFTQLFPTACSIKKAKTSAKINTKIKVLQKPSNPSVAAKKRYGNSFYEKGGFSVV